jgi:AcrR family transcriptional regulator
MSSPQRARPLRSDAARNLKLIHDAALDVISELGVEASMEQIANRAGVGVGTLYRRFPNKEALVAALANDIVDNLIASARDELEASAGLGLERFLHTLGRLLALYRGWAQQLLGRAEPSGRTDELRELIAQLVEQAREAGELAPHVTVGDIHLAMWGLRGVIEASGATAPQAWERYLDMHLAGLRISPAPTSRSSLSKAQLAVIAAEPH